MVLLYGFTVVHIRDRPCDFEQAVVCPCTERHMFKSHLQKIFPLFIQLAEFFYLASFEFSVELDSFILVSFPLQLLYFCHTLPDRVCRFSDPPAAQALEIDWRDIRTKIQAVEKWLADPSLGIFHLYSRPEQPSNPHVSVKVFSLILSPRFGKSQKIFHPSFPP